MAIDCRLTLWIGTTPPLVINAGRDRDYIQREAQGDYQFQGTTAGRGFQVGRGSQKHFVWTIQALDSEEKRAILNLIKNTQYTVGPPVNIRDETQRIEVSEIDGVGSRQRLPLATFPDSEMAYSGGAITVSHFETIGVLEISDRFEAAAGPNGDIAYSDLTFRVVEVV